MSTELAPVKASGLLDVDSKAQLAHEKRLGGFSWPMIAKEYGYSSQEDARQSVQAYLQRASINLTETTRKEHLNRELDRLNVLQSACWDDAVAGDLRAIETSLRIISQRIKLLGLEVTVATPTSTHQTIVIRGTKDEFIEKLAAITPGR